MPTVLSMALATFKFFDLKRHPYSCLVLAINQIKDVCESLRPRDEIDSVLRDAQDSTLLENPNTKYTVNRSKIYQNGESTVYMCKRKSDKKTFVMKEIPVTQTTDHTKAETALMQRINSPFVMRADEIYQHNNKLYIILEYMDGNEITKIINDFHGKYSKEFK